MVINKIQELECEMSDDLKIFLNDWDEINQYRFYANEQAEAEERSDYKERSIS